MSTTAGNCARATLMSVACFSVLKSGAQQLTPMPAGMTMTSNGVTLEVTALRDDVLRVRMWKGNAAPEDASWAILPAARSSRVAVVAEPHGFATGKLRVTADDQLQLTVADLAGNIIQSDAAPVRWNGSKFKVSKQGTWSDHFFRSVDRPQPLDRPIE